MEPARQLQILRIERVVRKLQRRVITIAAGDRRAHADRRQAIGFQTGLGCVRAGRVEMQAQEQVGVMFLSERDAIGERDFAVVGARQKHVPAVGGQQGLQTARPIERKLFFPRALHRAFGAGVLATMAGIQDQHRG